MSGRRPLPVPDELSTSFWQFAANQVLTVAQCSRCGSATMPPDTVCAHCGSTDPAFVFTPVGGSGTVRSWTVVRQSFLPAFEDDLPFVLVDVELTDETGVRLIGRLLDGPAADLTIGTAVTLAFEHIAAGVAVPAFELAR